MFIMFDVRYAFRCAALRALKRIALVVVPIALGFTLWAVTR